MKASELIDALNVAIKEHGDIDVMYYNDAGFPGYGEIFKITLGIYDFGEGETKCLTVE